MAAGNAQAASEVAQLAAGDNRVGIIATLALPALGWVAFNIAGPALNQLANMDDANKMRYHHAVHPPPKRTKSAWTVPLMLSGSAMYMQKTSPHFIAVKMHVTSEVTAAY